MRPKGHVCHPAAGTGRRGRGTLRQQAGKVFQLRQWSWFFYSALDAAGRHPRHYVALDKQVQQDRGHRVDDQTDITRWMGVNSSPTKPADPTEAVLRLSLLTKVWATTCAFQPRKNAMPPLRTPSLLVDRAFQDPDDHRNREGGVGEDEPATYSRSASPRAGAEWLR